MESEQLYHRGYCRNSYNSIASASSDEELLDGAGVIMDFHTTEDDNLLDGDAASPGRGTTPPVQIPPPLELSQWSC
ncbi:H(+)/Cl(-) exchange transporter 3 [Xyrichtys novacula]|uniref:H(+)/Cl(-) exchange transporter 3 n=1 Tax=Xyrichtys novacula TaxID=13765 RepID=A0AAV1HJD1_XYRNO|nr:H(+)/Cl(-) exchange transporter 3 [Xyrichtys novacula]